MARKGERANRVKKQSNSKEKQSIRDDVNFTRRPPVRRCSLFNKRATQQYGVDCIRVDEIQHSGKITDLILEHIATSEWLICDISTERPNVYYELGYAHGIKKEVILIAEAGSNIHFDIKDYNVILQKLY